MMRRQILTVRTPKITLLSHSSPDFLPATRHFLNPTVFVPGSPAMGRRCRSLESRRPFSFCTTKLRPTKDIVRVALARSRRSRSLVWRLPTLSRVPKAWSALRLRPQYVPLYGEFLLDLLPSRECDDQSSGWPPGHCPFGIEHLTCQIASFRLGDADIADPTAWSRRSLSCRYQTAAKWSWSMVRVLGAGIDGPIFPLGSQTYHHHTMQPPFKKRPRQVQMSESNPSRNEWDKSSSILCAVQNQHRRHINLRLEK